MPGAKRQLDDDQNDQQNKKLCQPGQIRDPITGLTEPLTEDHTDLYITSGFALGGTSNQNVGPKLWNTHFTSTGTAANSFELPSAPIVHSSNSTIGFPVTLASNMGVTPQSHIYNNNIQQPSGTGGIATTVAMHGLGAATDMPMMESEGYFTNANPPLLAYGDEAHTISEGHPSQSDTNMVLDVYAPSTLQKQTLEISLLPSPTPYLPPLGPFPSRARPNNTKGIPQGKAYIAMGYRADCEKCQNRVPGHYNHIIFR
ncbi:hypothetical protein N7466_011400 [Penicillium verhagenii]|uniref:uncharacterized protein n=1 Tax=Penicillium verhagenii TaxID=1562060 RepID=UPI002545A447|nr:uncharacterized protein N7466_011400 [Penicillium verhagenii]KAJ5915467.1 hypothetical protein N7466_011400 [Penicillium verhagenii]